MSPSPSWPVSPSVFLGAFYPWAPRCLTGLEAHRSPQCSGTAGQPPSTQELQGAAGQGGAGQGSREYRLSPRHGEWVQAGDSFCKPKSPPGSGGERRLECCSGLGLGTGSRVFRPPLWQVLPGQAVLCRGLVQTLPRSEALPRLSPPRGPQWTARSPCPGLVTAEPLAPGLPVAAFLQPTCNRLSADPRQCLTRSQPQASLPAFSSLMSCAWHSPLPGWAPLTPSSEAEGVRSSARARAASSCTQIRMLPGSRDLGRPPLVGGLGGGCGVRCPLPTSRPVQDGPTVRDRAMRRRLWVLPTHAGLV